LLPALIGVPAIKKALRRLECQPMPKFVDLRETAEAVATRCLKSRSFDCVVIGAGLRASPQLLLFEKLVNLVHQPAPGARVCFNTTPADTAEAVRRWV
jgi:ketopantoate hydroxymethyltransferase